MIGILQCLEMVLPLLFKDIDLDIQGYRPFIVYLNSEFWGLYNLREKVNEQFITIILLIQKK